MKKRSICLAVLATVLTLTATVGSAWAYFTTYAEARGSYTLSLEGHTTTVSENVLDWTKFVKIENAEGSGPVYVRARAFCGSGYSLSYTDADGRWSPAGDGYYYYNKAVAGGESTSELQVKIQRPENVSDPDDFNVVVIYETTKVRYNADGEPYADWSATLQTGTVEGGA